MSEKQKMIIIILGSFTVNRGWYEKHSKEYPRCEFAQTCEHPTIPINVCESSYVTIFIREDIGLLKNKVQNIINENIDSEIAIAVHGSSNRIEEVNTAINNFRNVHKPKVFNRTPGKDNIWDNLEPLINCIINNVQNYNELFDKIWQRLAPSSEVAHTLRSEILTPFIPFNFYYQMKYTLDDNQKNEWKKDVLNTSLTEIQKIIVGNQFRELLELKGVNENIEDGEKESNFSSLKQYFSKDISECMNNDCNNDINKFADYLEAVVTEIESKEEVKCL